MLRVALVAPEYVPLLEIPVQPLPEFSSHIYPETAPVATVVKEEFADGQTLALTGWEVMLNELEIVMVAAVEVSLLPQEPVTAHRY